MVVREATCSIMQEKISHENKRPFSFLLQPSYDVEFTDIKSTSNNKDYVDPVETSIGKDGSQSTLTIKATVKKEIPQDMMCQTKFYRKDDGEFKTAIFTMGPVPCCEISKYDVFKRIIDTQNVPKSCPFVPGTYSVDKYSFDRNRYKDVPRGEYLASFTAYLPTGDNTVIYGIDLNYKIVDKA
ncbi:hypothetical protein Cfor_05636 [Coptotermes formosanus]|uniref:MD-2-related lipid-recognition domain-containing protein n=1 Tax=Coptotermes formosanus TaxID=36987 RepID=A0A6L2PUZ3_COPFO|nr:hypothetical protein Cfor_05636 [Coptotermes formosanus]